MRKKIVQILFLSMLALSACAKAGSSVATSADATTSNADATDYNNIVAMDIDGSLLPALDMELPTIAPPPEYIRIGTEHPIIAKVQARLMTLEFMENDEPTTYYGNASSSAVRAFQRQHSLAVDGVLGPETLALLMSDDAKSYAAKEGDEGDDIKRIQERLYSLGYLANSAYITGKFGEKTVEAVKAFQDRNGTSPDGTVGHNTLNLFYSEDVKANLLAFGDKSEVVQTAQQRLYALGYLTTTPDGTYGKDTSDAVKRFQEKNELEVDGYLGPTTRDVLLSSTALPNSLSVGDSGSQVVNIQKRLIALGYLRNGNATGKFGDLTDAAVKAFQSRNGLSSDGQAGAMTIAKLNSDSAVKAPAPTVSASGSSGRKSSSKSGSSSSSAPVYSGGGGGASALISVAASKVGSPYVWGSKGPNTFDCSGFVYWCLNQVGVRQSYMTSYGWRSAGRYSRISSFGELRAGDIIVVPGHVGIVAGGGEVIDASSSNGRVVRRSLSGWWSRNFIVGWRIF